MESRNSTHALFLYQLAFLFLRVRPVVDVGLALQLGQRGNPRNQRDDERQRLATPRLSDADDVTVAEPDGDARALGTRYPTGVPVTTQWWSEQLFGRVLPDGLWATGPPVTPPLNNTIMFRAIFDSGRQDYIHAQPVPGALTTPEIRPRRRHGCVYLGSDLDGCGRREAEVLQDAADLRLKVALGPDGGTRRRAGGAGQAAASVGRGWPGNPWGTQHASVQFGAQPITSRQRPLLQQRRRRGWCGATREPHGNAQWAGQGE